MRSWTQKTVVSFGMAVSCAILFAESPYCPPGCDCDVVTSSTAPCATGITICTGVTPTQVNGVFKCNDATYIVPDWPKGCTKSTWNEDYGKPTYDNWTNCNEPNTNCTRPTTCIYVSSHCLPGTPYGN